MRLNLKKKFHGRFPNKSEISCFWAFSAFLGFFETFYGVMTPPDQKKISIFVSQKIWVLLGHSGVTVEKVQILPYNAPLGRCRAKMGRNGPEFGQTHKTPNFYHIVGTNP